MREQRKVYEVCVQGAQRCQSLVERRDSIQQALADEAEMNAAAAGACTRPAFSSTLHKFGGICSVASTCH
jgi:hypothetical protein